MSTKWKCPKCSSVNDTDYRKCNCGQIVSEEEQKKYNISDAEADSLFSYEVSSSSSHADAGNHSIVSRYRDAYLTARTTTGFGSTIKFVAFVISGLIVLMGFIAGSHSAQYVIGSVILGALVGIPIYILGILVSAQGQILKATLDSAVNSSQFLTKDEMRKMMSVD